MQALPSVAKAEDITCILRKVEKTNSQVDYDTLFPLVYEQLLNIAQRRLLREQRGHTYSRTDLVHEAYFQLREIEEINWNDRSHFYAIASRCMRRLLIDHARKKNARKRGGSERPSTYHDEFMQVQEEAEELVMLDEALKKLAELDERLAQVVECRYFGELSIEDTAEALQISASTVKRDWAKARGWLYNELKDRFA